MTVDGQVGLNRCSTHERERLAEKGRRVEAERRQRVVDEAPKYLRRAGFFLEHCDAKLEDFAPAIRQREPEILGAVGVLIKGPVGTGKTRLAAAISRELLIAGRKVFATTVADLFGRLRASFRDGSEESEEQIVSDLRHPAIVLVLDDLGFEGTTTPLVISALHRILSARNGDRLLTLVTTNLKQPEIEQVYGAAVGSRLKCWAQIVVDGPDRRQG